MTRLTATCLLLMLAVVPVGQAAAQAHNGPLRLWTSQFEPRKLSAIQYIMTAYSAINGVPGIEVTGFDEDEFEAKWLEAQRAGNLPDLIEAPRRVLELLNHRGRLDTQAVDDAVAGIGASTFRTGLLGLMKSPRGHGNYGIPMHAWVQGVWYRQDWFQRDGLAPPDSLETLLAAARHYHDPSNGRYGIVLGTGNSIYAEQSFLQFAKAFGADPYDASQRGPDMKLRMSAAFAYYRDLARHAPPAPVGWQENKLFMDGKAAMIVYSSFLLDKLFAADDDGITSISFNAREPADGAEQPRLDDVEVATCIRGHDQVTCGQYGEISGLGIVKNGGGKVNAEAVDLVKFMFRPDAYATWIHMKPGGMLPTVKNEALSYTFYFDVNRTYIRFGRSRFENLIGGFSTGGMFQNELSLSSRFRADGRLSKFVADVAQGKTPPNLAADGVIRLIDEYRRTAKNE